eukprot:TRINITY_DN1447_c0_g1_i11.p1 TRINITY_DN1447_c0_g1~~TRINITY_DN1447_c0_g1_i11.p1  ORF type:complete len:171 (-),score=41.29 TRINITY_DN1447_c0_g1_i11:170-682(-)
MSKGKQSSGEAKEPVKVYKWDGTAVKNALDDAVKEVMTAKLPYTENFNLMDGRLVICAIAVGVAMFALLWDFLNPFPKSRPVLIGCVASYFLLMGVLTLYTTFKEKGIFVVVMQKDPAGLDPDSTWEAASNMKSMMMSTSSASATLTGRPRPRGRPRSRNLLETSLMRTE